MAVRNLMVIDDNEAEQLLARMIVARHDKSINVIVASDGKEALEILAEMEEPPEVLLLDINMPRMSGMEFLANFSSLYKDSKVKVAMCSGSTSEKEQALGYECVFSYFEKPLSVKNLEAMAEFFSG